MSTAIADNRADCIQRIRQLERLIYTRFMPKLCVVPKRMTKTVEIDGTIEKTEDGLIVKSITGEMIGRFDPDCQWWIINPPEPAADYSGMSPAALESYQRLLKVMRSGAVTDEQWSRITAVLERR